MTFSCEALEEDIALPQRFEAAQNKGRTGTSGSGATLLFIIPGRLPSGFPVPQPTPAGLPIRRRWRQVLRLYQHRVSDLSTNRVD